LGFTNKGKICFGITDRGKYVLGITDGVKYVLGITDLGKYVRHIYKTRVGPIKKIHRKYVKMTSLTYPMEQSPSSEAKTF
jgi:hypothetical protein